MRGRDPVPELYWGLTLNPKPKSLSSRERNSSAWCCPSWLFSGWQSLGQPTRPLAGTWGLLGALETRVRDEGLGLRVEGVGV